MDIRYCDYKRYSGEVKLSHPPAWRSVGADKYSHHAVDCDSKRNCIVARASLLRGTRHGAGISSIGRSRFVILSRDE